MKSSEFCNMHNFCASFKNELYTFDVDMNRKICTPFFAWGKLQPSSGVQRNSCKMKFCYDLDQVSQATCL